MLEAKHMKHLSTFKTVVARLSKRIQEQGQYENAGQDELRKFRDKIMSNDLISYHQKHLILVEAERLIDNL